MSRVIDVKNVQAEVRRIASRPEVRKLAESKPVHAAAGAGVLASQTLRELPGRLAKWRTDANANVSDLPRRASGYVTVVRTRAATGYDKLAVRGKRAMNGSTTQRRGGQSRRAVDNGKGQ